MHRYETQWILSNIANGFQSDLIYIDEACRLVSEINPGELENWFVWKPGWANWKAVADVPELFMEALIFSPEMLIPPPLPALRHAVTAPEPIVELVKEPQATALERRNQGDRRQHQRFEIRLRVIIRNDQLTFRTFTRDISLGGVSLEQPVPERLLQGKSQIFIAAPQGSTSARFSLRQTARSERRYFSFDGLDAQSSDKLSTWLSAAAAKKSAS